jgi:hypothetical protein
MVDRKEVYHIESIIKQALLVVKNQKKQEKQEKQKKYIFGFLTTRLVQEENELKNNIEFWIIEFYMLNPRHIGLQNLLTETNEIIEDMKVILDLSFENLNLFGRVHDVGNVIHEKTLISELIQEKQRIIETIMEYTKNSVKYFIKLI